MKVHHPVRPSFPPARPTRWAALWVAALLAAAPASAQVTTPASYDEGYWSDEIPAHLSVVEGTATLERDGRVERAEPNLILLAGDRLSTDRGRLEILFADGSAVAADEFTTIDVLDAALMRLSTGQVRVTIARATGAVEYRIDTVAGSAQLLTPGEFKVALLNADSAYAEVDLTVMRGSAELANQYGRTRVRAGTHAVARADAAPSLPYAANSAAWSDFDGWAEAQQDARLGYSSARYLPSELHYNAGVFDRHGSWAYEPAYSTYVWYPQVGAGWRPYSAGRWSFVARFGYVWVGVDRWSWPTHHYGRWGVNAGRWYWIPGRRWGPAWVSWASAPGYVGWCPLGFDNRPVFSVTSITVNYYQPHFGWTVLPRQSFGHNVIVTDHRVGPRRAVPREWSQFAEQQAAPAPPNVAMRTAQGAPLRSPSAARTALRRDGTAPATARSAATTPDLRAGTPAGGRTAVPATRGSLQAPASATAGAAVRRAQPSAPPTIAGATPGGRVAAPTTRSTASGSRVAAPAARSAATGPARTATSRTPGAVTRATPSTRSAPATAASGRATSRSGVVTTPPATAPRGRTRGGDLPQVIYGSPSRTTAPPARNPAPSGRPAVSRGGTPAAGSAAPVVRGRSVSSTIGPSAPARTAPPGARRVGTPGRTTTPAAGSNRGGASRVVVPRGAAPSAAGRSRSGGGVAAPRGGAPASRVAPSRGGGTASRVAPSRGGGTAAPPASSTSGGRASRGRTAPPASSGGGTTSGGG